MNINFRPDELGRVIRPTSPIVAPATTAPLTIRVKGILVNDKVISAKTGDNLIRVIFYEGDFDETALRFIEPQDMQNPEWNFRKVMPAIFEAIGLDSETVANWCKNALRDEPGFILLEPGNFNVYVEYTYSVSGA